MRIPYVIDNQTSKLADAQRANRSLDIASCRIRDTIIAGKETPGVSSLRPRPRKVGHSHAPYTALCAAVAACVMPRPDVRRARPNMPPDIRAAPQKELAGGQVVSLSPHFTP